MATLSEMSALDGVQSSFGASAVLNSGTTSASYYVPAVAKSITCQAGLSSGEYYLEACADPRSVIEGDAGYWFGLDSGSLTVSRQIDIDGPLTAVRCRRVSGTIRFSVLARG